jgi:hypothetical protein
MSGAVGRILRDAGGDVVGYPALELARKLKDPQLIPAVYDHFQFVLKAPVSTSYLEFCRGTLLGLETARLHQERGVKVDLPTSIYKLLSGLTEEEIENERNPIRRALFLRHLSQARSFPADALGRICAMNLKIDNVLVRWCAVELAVAAPADSTGDLLRDSFRQEQIPALVGLLAEAAFVNWRPSDCALLADKLREYCTVSGWQLNRTLETIHALMKYAVRNSCKEATKALGLLAETIEPDARHKSAAESIRRTIRLLEG